MKVSPRSPQGGFTLLELLAAIAIAALILGLSAPATMRFYSSAQYRGAVKDVVAMLNSGRYAAISDGATRDVVIKPRTRQLQLGKTMRQLPDSVELEVLSARELNREGEGVIRFYPDGSASGGVVRLRHDRGMETEVQVDWLLGSVELCKSDCGEHP